METITLVKGDAGPTLRFTIYQDETAVDLSGAGVGATWRQRAVGSTSNLAAITCTGLDSNGYCYVPLTTTSCATADEYTAEINITGLAGGTQTTDLIRVVVRDSLA
jgi:hypothetical protein